MAADQLTYNLAHALWYSYITGVVMSWLVGTDISSLAAPNSLLAAFWLIDPIFCGPWAPMICT